MSAEENKTIVRRYLEDVWSQGDLDAADEIVTAAVVFRSPLRQIEGLAAFKQFVAGVRTVFPDIHFTTDDLIAEGDCVAARWTMTGTQEGDFMGIPASGRHFTVPGVSILRPSGGQVAEAELFWDRLSLMDQIGAAPAEAGD